MRSAHNPVRRRLFEAFSTAYLSLTGAGCSSVYLDGSYVTDKPLPRDFDACWDPTGVDPSMLDPVLLDFADGRRRQKETFGGELFPSRPAADGTIPFVVFFSVDRETGRPKGLVRLISAG